MHRLLAATILSLWLASETTPAQTHWSPPAYFSLPKGYEVVEAGQGWGFTIDLVPVGESPQKFPLARMAFLISESTPNQIAQQLFKVDDQVLAAAGWDLLGSEAIEHTFFLDETEEGEEGDPIERKCSGQLLSYQQKEDPDQKASMQIFAWDESNGSIGVLRTFAASKSETDSVDVFIRSLSTSGISPYTTRKVQQDGYSFTIPITAAYQSEKSPNNESIYQITHSSGTVQMIVGEPLDAIESVNLAEVRENAIKRFKEMEKNGLGTALPPRSIPLLRGSRLIPQSKFSWQAQGQESVEISTVAFAMEKRIVLLRTYPNPGASAECTSILESLARGGLRGKKSIPIDWNMLDLPHVHARIPQGFDAKWESVNKQPGLLLFLPESSTSMWMGSRAVAKGENLQQELRQALVEYLENNTISSDLDSFVADTTVISIEEDYGGFYDEIDCELARIRFIYKAEGTSRVSTAIARQFEEDVYISILDADSGDQKSMEQLQLKMAEHAIQGLKGTFVPINNGRFPLKYPRGNWVVLSHGGGSMSEAKLFSPSGVLKIKHSMISENMLDKANAYAATIYELVQERSQVLKKFGQAKPSVKSMRFLGSKLGQWHSFSYNQQENTRIISGSVWFDERNRYQLIADYMYPPDPANLAETDFMAAFEQLEIDRVAGNVVPEKLDTWPLPYGGTWMQVPRSLKIVDFKGVPSGFAFAVEAHDAQDWTIRHDTFLAPESLSDEDVFAYLWEYAKETNWAVFEGPQATSFSAELFGEIVPGREKAGLTSQNQSWIVRHLIHRQGRICRSLTLRGSEMALESILPTFDFIRKSMTRADGFITAPAAQETQQISLADGVTWTIPKEYSNPVVLENGATSYMAEGFGELRHQKLAKAEHRPYFGLSILGMKEGQPVPSLAEAKKLGTPFILEHHNHLHAALAFSIEGFPAAITVVPLGKVDHIVMVSSTSKPIVDLAQIIQGWPVE